MNEIKIPFGRRADGEMVSVDTVSRGLECNCVCASCGAPLIARKGEINQHHFAHSVDQEHCVAARESSIHRFAKQVICDELIGEYQRLHLPDGLDLGVMRNAKSEQWLDGIRPDVLLEFDIETAVAIEVFVNHRVDSDKLKKIVLRKLATLEIDLSSYRNVDKTEEEWRDIVLRQAPRFWLYQPAIVRERIEREAKEEAERRLRIEQEAKRQAEEHAQRIARMQEEADRRRWLREIKERQDREFEEMVAAEMWRRATQRVRVPKEIDPLLAGLKLCADTDRHLTEWERRKAVHREAGR